MAYHEAFWATSATVAAAILVAAAVALGQSIDTMVERVRQRRIHHEAPGSREWINTRRRSLVRSYLCAIGSIALTTLALLMAMVCLLNESDIVAPWLGAVLLFVGIALIFLQIFAAADAKLAEVRHHRTDDNSELS